MPHTRSAGVLFAGVDLDGTVTAVWEHSDRRGGRYSFWSAEHPPGGTWSRPVRLGGGREGDVGWLGADLAVGPSGAAVFVWVPEYGPARVRFRAADRNWAAVPVLPNPDASSPVIAAVDLEGLATVAYVRQEVERTKVESRPGAPGTIRTTTLLTLMQGSVAGWQKPVELELSVGAGLYDIDAAGGGEVVVAWQQPDDHLATGRLRAGRLTDPRALSESDEPLTALDVQAAADGSARFVWMPGDPEASDSEGRDGAEPEKLHSVYQSASGVLDRPEIVGTTGRCGTAAMLPIVDRNRRGDTIVGWSGTSRSGLDIAFRRRGDTRWVPQGAVVPGVSGPSCYAAPLIDLADSGSAIVVWQNLHSNDLQLSASELLARRAMNSR